MNVIAVDVGTTSVRLAIISFKGDYHNEAIVLGSHKKDIEYHQDGVRFEQNSTEIWNSICECCKECIEKTKIRADSIKGIAFSATCSLVVAQDQANQNDIIMWMDHRAVEEAQKITSSNSRVLEQFGGVCSPEFSLAKLVWLRENEPLKFERATGFFELPDWLVYRCSNQNVNSSARSLCCLTCKWGFDSDLGQHCDIIKSLDPKASRKIGELTIGPGTVADYMSLKAAKELGILSDDSELGDKENSRPLDIVVGTSLIDAHSGMLAMLSVSLENYNIRQDVEATFCSLAGTSSCHMLLSKKANFTAGIWGPYKDVILRDFYLLEAGQSMTGKLIELSIRSHQEGVKRLESGEKMYEIIGSLNDLARCSELAGDLYILPSFHGNRSPLANPRLKGGIYGLSAAGSRSLLDYYMATVESLAYETKLIAETLGKKFTNMLVSGGLMKNNFYMQTLADVLQCRVIIMSLENIDFMVMGSGLVARHAVLSHKKKFGRLEQLSTDSIKGIKYDQLNINIYEPRPKRFAYHEKGYLCYKEFVEFSLKIDRITQFYEKKT